jgi:hypothetical protein
LTFVGLPVDSFDFAAAANLPVRGSSVFHGEEKSVHWKPVAKTSEFDPIGRSSHWKRPVHERFNWIAGRQQVWLGYEREQYKSNAKFWAIWNKTMDRKWRLTSAVESLVKFVKKTLKWTLGAVGISKADRILDFRRVIGLRH